MRAAVGGHKSDVEVMVRQIYDNEQVLVFDECHLLFACPAFYQQFLKNAKLFATASDGSAFICSV